MNLREAILAYRAILLEEAVGHLVARKACLPSPFPAAAIKARDRVLEIGMNVSAEKFTAELMAAGFLDGPKS